MLKKTSISWLFGCNGSGTAAIGKTQCAVLFMMNANVVTSFLGPWLPMVLSTRKGFWPVF
jgi:hypothetical protein